MDQSTDQAALRNGGTGTQDAAQLAYVSQEASAHSTTTQRAGAAALPLASSEATAVDRAWIAQAAAQTSFGSADDLQETLQESVVVQRATAISTSNGGIAGSAVVVNCAVTQQGATQSIGAGPATAAGSNLAGFCFSPTAGDPSPYSAPPLSGAPALFSTGVPAGIESAAAEEEPTLFHGRGSAAVPSRATSVARRSAPLRTAPRAARPRAARDEAFRPALHASAPRHAPGELRGSRRRRPGAAALAGGGPTCVGLRARSRRVRYGADGDRSDPPGLRARAAGALCEREKGRSSGDRPGSFAPVEVPV